MSITKRPDGKWRARYRGPDGKEHASHHRRRVDAHKWYDEQTATMSTGAWVSPRDARITVAQWCSTWLDGYRGNRASTVRQAEVHLAQIRAEFGSQQLSAVRPSQIKSWTVRLKNGGLSESYIYALHSRLSQVLASGFHPGGDLGGDTRG